MPEPLMRMCMLGETIGGGYPGISVDKLEQMGGW
jgi:hypothetical protein